MSALWSRQRSKTPSPAISSPGVASPLEDEEPDENNDDPNNTSLASSRGRSLPRRTPSPRPPVAVDMAYPEREQLPLPVSAGVPSVSGRKRARIDQPTRPPLKVHWARFVKRMATATAPSSSSAMGGDESTNGDNSFYFGRARKNAAAPGQVVPNLEDDEKGEVDEVVVDREWSHDVKTSVVEGGSEDKDYSHHPGTIGDQESLAVDSKFWGSCTPLIVLRYRFWPAVVNFFNTRFYDEKSERQYARESWYMKKSLAMWSALFMILNWTFATAFVPPPWTLADKVFYGGISSIFTLPLFFFVVFDVPRDHDVLYQIFLTISVWSWGFYQIVFMYLCGYYSKPHAHLSCGVKDFIGTFYYTTGIPTIALFGLGYKRLPAAFGALAFFITACPLILQFRESWFRNLLNFAIFQGFLLYVHYMREHAERRLYTLRDQLKVQFRATQKAQVNERRAADSKRRLTSYVFHEVRVPLNTALLAVQNMAATGTFAQAPDIEFSALEGSLGMMSKVLNDVLDFNRMDSGRFESVSKPFAFHQVMQSMFVPLRLATNARKLTFVTHLDSRIDLVARRAALYARGTSILAIPAMLAASADEPGMVVGDEMRLRQIITNLASNACKFTPAGGTLTITTKLLWPNKIAEANSTPLISETLRGSGKGSGDTAIEAHDYAYKSGSPATDVEKGREEDGEGPGLSSKLLAAHDAAHERPPERIIVRIEVSDTGCGIKNADMVHNKLFSAFNQTDVGRQQGGKGTGLGLALVRQIVKRTGGRLGVQSKIGEGSTFWCELPFDVGPGTIDKYGASRSAFPQSQGPDELAILAGNPMQTANIAAEAAEASEVRTSDVRSSFNIAKRPRESGLSNSSEVALESLMDQGGLLQLVNGGDRSTTSIPTRTIGDASTGTDVIPSSPAIEVNRSLESPSLSIGSSLGHLPMVRSPLSGAPSHDDSLSRPTISEESSSATVVPVTPRTGPGMIALPPRPFSQPNDASSQKKLSGPVSPRKANRPPPLATPLPQTKSKTPVLVVDDDHLTRTLMKRMLTRLGCEVTTAENGALALLALGLEGPTPASESGHSATAAMAAAAKGLAPPGTTADGEWFTEDSKFAVVFLDNQMPVLSGLQAVARLRCAGRRDFVVGVTGNALLSDQEEYIDAGVDHVLTKPVLERSLRSMIDAAHSRRMSRFPNHIAANDATPSPNSMTPPTPPT